MFSSSKITFMLLFRHVCNFPAFSPFMFLVAGPLAAGLSFFIPYIAWLGLVSFCGCLTDSESSSHCMAVSCFTLFHQVLRWSSCLAPSNFRHAGSRVVSPDIVLVCISCCFPLVCLVKSMALITTIDALLVTGTYPITLSETSWYGALTSTQVPEWSPLSLTHSTSDLNLFYFQFAVA